MNNEQKNNAKRIAFALYNQSNPSMIQQLAILLNYNDETQLTKDISELIAYLEYLEESKDRNKLKNVRKLKGFTQNELAELANMSRQSIANWESGYRNISLTNAKKLAKALECSIDDIV